MQRRECIVLQVLPWVAPQSTHRAEIADCWRAFHHDGKMSPAGGVGGCSPPSPPFALLPSRTKLQCTLQLRGQIHTLYFICCCMAKPCTHAQGRRTTRCACSAWRRGWASTRCMGTAGPSQLSSSIDLTRQPTNTLVSGQCCESVSAWIRIILVT
jgi:hypothetical protein